MSAAELEQDIERLTVGDLRTIQDVMTALAADHRRNVSRLERAEQIASNARKAALLRNREAATRYERIAARVGREILELEWEL